MERTAPTDARRAHGRRYHVPTTLLDAGIDKRRPPAAQREQRKDPDFRRHSAHFQYRREMECLSQLTRVQKQEMRAQRQIEGCVGKREQRKLSAQSRGRSCRVQSAVRISTRRPRNAPSPNDKHRIGRPMGAVRKRRARPALCREWRARPALCRMPAHFAGQLGQLT